MKLRPRSPWRVTLAVWHALLLREAVARLFGKRAAWLWLLVEPLAYIAFMAGFFSAFHARAIGGMDTTIWLTSGLLAFFVFRRCAIQGVAAVNANQALYAYRQVLPVDTVLVRCVLEALLMVVTAALVAMGLALMGRPIGTDDALTCFLSVAGLWLLALGWALAASVAGELVPEFSHVLNMFMVPTALISGAFFPLSSLPPSWRSAFMLNPIAHGVEGARAGISDYYHHAPELSLAYLMACALVLLFFGLALQLRFRHRLVTL